jgi:hypothetical protein
VLQTTNKKSVTIKQDSISVVIAHQAKKQQQQFNNNPATTTTTTTTTTRRRFNQDPGECLKFQRLSRRSIFFDF